MYGHRVHPIATAPATRHGTTAPTGNKPVISAVQYGDASTDVTTAGTYRRRTSHWTGAPRYAGKKPGKRSATADTIGNSSATTRVNPRDGKARQTIGKTTRPGKFAKQAFPVAPGPRLKEKDLFELVEHEYNREQDNDQSEFFHRTVNLGNNSDSRPDLFVPPQAENRKKIRIFVIGLRAGGRGVKKELTIKQIPQ